MILLGVGSLINSNTIRKINPLDFFQVDKLMHLTAYAILTFLWIYVLNEKGSKHFFFKSLSIAIVYGIALECAQYVFFTGRSFEFLDIMANIIGAIIGAFLTKYLLKI